MINKVVLTGRLVKDVELKYTPNGVPVGNFTLAVNRSFKDAQGNKETDFIQCVVWQKSAEAMATHLRKGSLIGVDGRIQTRSYEGQDKKRVFVTELVVENFTFLESKAQQQKESEPPQYNRYGA